MTSQLPPRSHELPADLQRLVGFHGDDRSGPLVICVGGIHGNELAGVVAARRVAGDLAALTPPFRGRFVALAGNLQALARDRRYIDRDLNRSWMPERIRQLSEEGPGEEACSEDHEMHRLLQAIDRETRDWKGPVYFLDLHTNSAGGAPFVCIGDTLRNRAFALKLCLPVVLGLEEQIDGALLEYMNNRGYVTVGVEAGGHRQTGSVEHHEAVVRLALEAAGNLSADALPGQEEHRQVLRSVSEGMPPIVEVRTHHRVAPGDGFRMKPGFKNFDPVRRGAVVATDGSGEIRVREACRLLLPLYQSQGSDGFFTVRRVGAFWLALSAALRRSGLPSLMWWLPGVRRHPHREETLVVDTRLARFLPLQVFHLMGFRKRRWQGSLLLVTRRRHDTGARLSPSASGRT